MKRHIVLVSLLTATLVMVGLTVGWAQALGDNASRARAGLTNVLGARVAAMGGAAVAVPQDGTAFYWNPAALASQRNFRLTGSLGGSAAGLSAVDDLKDIVDIIDEASTGVAIDTGDFFTVRDIIIRNDGQTIRGEVGALGSLQWNGFAIGYWAIAGGDAGVDHTETAPGSERVDWDATAAGQASVGIAYGQGVSDRLDVGIAARNVWAGSGFSQGDARADGIDPDARTVANATYGAINDGADYDSAITVDLGLMYSASERVRYGLVGRNLTSPSFSGVPGFDGLDASVDLGYAYTTQDGGIFAVDLHNATAANGKGSSVAVGFAAPLGQDVQIRAGYGNGSPTLGLGLSIGGFALDLASALDWEDRVAISGSVAF